MRANQRPVCICCGNGRGRAVLGERPLSGEVNIAPAISAVRANLAAVNFAVRLRFCQKRMSVIFDLGGGDAALATGTL